jgi:hypothetical protein
MDKFNDLFFVLMDTIKDFGYNVDKAIQKYHDTERKTYIDYTLSKLRPHMTAIMEEDNFLFSSDYGKGELKLIYGIDFKSFWDTLERGVQIKIFNLLRDLYLNGSFALKVGLKDPVVKRVIEILKEEEHINAQVTRDIQREEEKKKGEEQSDPLTDIMSSLTQNMDFNSLASIFDENNPLIKLTKEISEEVIASDEFKKMGVDPNTQLDNPSEAITKLLSNPDLLMGMVSSFGKKLEIKIKENNIDISELQKVTNQIGEKVMKNVNQEELAQLVENTDLVNLIEDKKIQ